MSTAELWIEVARALRIIAAALEARYQAGAVNQNKRAERQTWWDGGLT